MLSDTPTVGPPPIVILRDAATGRWRYFARPRYLVTATRIDDVLPALQAVETAVERDGMHAAGFLAYEAAPAFDPLLPTRFDTGFPLLWFGLYNDFEESADLSAVATGQSPVADWRPSITQTDYQRAFAAIRQFIRNGDTYQVNFTYRLRDAAPANPWYRFLQWVDAQEPLYGAYLDTGDWIICSASPELFFRLDGDHIESRPMKGTAPRGLWPADDRRQARALRASPKQRAENVMIVDMVRNDLGYIAETGSVTVPALFTVERYPTVWQLVSTVAATTQAPLYRIFQALFPAASITGAPKRRTMEIITQLESSPRRIYTGAIGFISPRRRAQFNVAIRTVLIDRKMQTAEYGVGGGIVWDSRSGDEWRESQLKARILHHARPRFDLLETLRWEPEQGYFLLHEHLWRLARSAACFGFAADRQRIRLELERAVLPLPPLPHRVRLRVSRTGATCIETSPLPTAPAGFADIIPAWDAVDAADPFLYHKTTHRCVYEDALKTRPDFTDVILFNARNEVTESTIANVIVEIDGTLFTPPVHCGLLAGTYRNVLLRRKTLHERVIGLDELLASPTVYLINSVRGLHKVTVIHPDTHQVIGLRNRDRSPLLPPTPSPLSCNPP